MLMGDKDGSVRTSGCRSSAKSGRLRAAPSGQKQPFVTGECSGKPECALVQIDAGDEIISTEGLLKAAYLYLAL